MKFINPSVEYWKQNSNINGVWSQIAKATRVCYQSVQKKEETDEEFVKRVILKPALIEGDLNDLEHCKFDNLKMHGAMLEHGTVYLILQPRAIQRDHEFMCYIDGKYTRYRSIKTNYYITTNVRVLLEYGFADYISKCVIPTESHVKRYTFSVITDIGVTREFNRHRKFSIAEQSTRYCDFNKDKFGEELTFIYPAWGKKEQFQQTYDRLSAYKAIEEAYLSMRKYHIPPEQARQVLPLGLKTQAVYTAFADDWKHFLALRADNASGRVHPNMKVVADMIKQQMKDNNISLKL